MHGANRRHGKIDHMVGAQPAARKPSSATAPATVERWTHWLSRAAVIGLLAFSGGGALPSPAAAAAEVQGSADAVQIRVENASTGQVLDLLAAKFKLTYKLPPNVTRELSGDYAGTLQQVLARILDGSDYILSAQGDSLSVMVLGASGATAVATSGPAIRRLESVPTVQPSSSPPTASAPPPIASAPPPAPVEPVRASVAPPPILPAASAPPPLKAYLSANTP